MRKILQILKQNWIKYGFETVVVTVGILGAFTLESWKDSRQEEKELFEIYRTITEDLYTDTLALDTILEDYWWRMKYMDRILTEPLSMDEWIENDSLSESFVGYPSFRESLRGLDLFKSKITTGGEAGILAGRISNFYNEKLLKNSVTRNEVDDFLYDNIKHWVDDGTWLSAVYVDKNVSLLGEYVEDNPYFRNRLTAYLLVFVNHYLALSQYKEEGAELAEEIKTFLENNN